MSVEILYMEFLYRNTVNMRGYEMMSGKDKNKTDTSRFSLTFDFWLDIR